MNRLFQGFVVVCGLGLVSQAGAEEPLSKLRDLDLKFPESVLVTPADQTPSPAADASALPELSLPSPVATAAPVEGQFESPLPSIRVAAAPGPQLNSASSSSPVNTGADVGITSKDPSELLAELNAGKSATADSEIVNDRLQKVRRVVEIYRPKMLNTRTHGPWETMHAIIAYGVDTKIHQDGPYGQPVTAIGWLAYNRPAAGQRLFYARREGGVGALTGPGLQGHAGQFLAIVAQSRLDKSYPIQADGKQFTIEDLIEFEKLTCKPRSELTFKLIALAHYLDSDASWTSEDGEDWNIQRLIREELAQPINGVACGGTHRLFGLSYAVYQRAKQGKPMVGEFARAKKFISDYQKYTYALQNSDGSFSTDWFKGREAKNDLDRRMQTTGHILEWMVFSSPAEDLEDPRLTKAVDYLSYILLANQSRDWAIGPRGHAIHAMDLYDTRMTHLLKQRQQDLVNGENALPETETSTENSDADSDPVTISFDKPFLRADSNSSAK